MDRVCVYTHAPNPIHYVLSLKVSPIGLTYGVGFWLRIVVTRSVEQIVHGLADPEDILLTSSQYDKVFAYFYRIVKSPRPEYVRLHLEKPIALLFSETRHVRAGNRVLHYATNIDIENPELTYFRIIREGAVDPRHAERIGLTLDDVISMVDRLSREYHRSVKYVAWLVDDYVYRFMLFVVEPYYARHNMVTIFIEHDYAKLPYVPYVEDLEICEYPLNIKGDIYWQHTTIGNRYHIKGRGGALSWRDEDYVYCLVRASERNPAIIYTYPDYRELSKLTRSALLRLRVS